MNIRPFKAVFPKVDLITSPSSFFSNIKFQYSEYRNSGFYTETDKESIYIYQIRTRNKISTGMLCCTDINDFREQKILKHEKTLAAKEQQMMHLFLQRKALVKPVLLGYKSFDGIEKLLLDYTETHEPEIHIKFPRKEAHLIWTVDKEDIIEEITSQFRKLKKAYIADGHHRSTTVLLLNSSKDLGDEAQKYDHLLTAYFPFSDLIISDYNRIVDIYDIMPTSRFMAMLSKYFKIERSNRAQRPSRKHQLSFYIDKSWYLMEWKHKYLRKGEFPLVLDAALINHYVFDKILHIKDIRLDTRISYYNGTQSLSKIRKDTDRKKAGVAICIFPVSEDDLTRVADQLQTLPPKSTWFEPRVKSGIIAKDL